MLKFQAVDFQLVAIKDIPRETVLFTIPRALILSVETSELCEKIPAIFDESSSDEDVEPLDTWARLILVLLYEYLQGINSKWKPYFDVLPDKFDTPIFWSETELEALRGTCLTDEKIGKTESENMLRTRILPIIRNNTSIFFSRESSHMRDADLLALAHRMGSTIMAYAFDLETENEQLDEEIDGWVEDREGNTMLGMVPMADMLNADAEFNVCNAYEKRLSY